MSLFTDASLVLIPSGVKIGTAYSIKPTDGTGDLTFTRSNDTATRIGSDGLIQKVYTNVLLQSNTFTTSWGLSGTTITSGQTGYDGLSDAWLLSKDAFISRYIFQYLSFSGLKTFSVFAKANTLNNVRLYSTTGTSSTADFSLVDGSLLASANILGSSSEDLGNGWWRFSITTDGTSSLFRIYPDPDGTTAGSIYFQNAQLETGDIATQYLATTTAAVSVGPVANTPRLDYSGGATCPKLLLEPQRTNLMTFSESFDNADWSLINATITPNADISPDGYTNADRIYDDAASTQHRVSQNVSVVSATTYTFSVFAKKGSLRYCYLLTNAAGSSERYYFDLQDGVSITAGGKIEDYGSGWYRISAQVTADATGNCLFTFNLNDSPSGTTYSGTGTGYHMIYGYQVEAGSYITSYIPTIAATTKGADSCSKTGISSLFGATATTFVLDFVKKQNALGWTITGSNGSKLFSIAQFDTLAGYPRVVFDDGVDTGSSLAVLSNGRHKIAVSYATNDTRVYIDGTLVLTDTSCTYYQMDRIGANATAWTGFTNNNLAFEINQFLMIPAATTNAQLAELTA